MTPAQRKYGETKCWRSCGAIKADHFHIFWGCPLIKQHWIEIKRVIEEVIEIKIPTRFEMMYLRNIDPLNLKRGEDHKMLRILLLAAKKAISRRWRCLLVPKVEEWTDVWLSFYVITATLRLEVEKCNNTWNGWLQRNIE